MRILLGIVLALSVSFACDQPYEEVGGYKIGCPFDDKVGFVRDESRTDNGRIVYKASLKDSFFKEVALEVIGGNIEAVDFTRDVDDAVSPKEFSDFIRAVSNRWGEFEDNIFFLENNPSNSVVAYIDIWTTEEKDRIHKVSYETQRYKDFIEKSVKQREKKITEEFSRF